MYLYAWYEKMPSQLYKMHRGFFNESGLHVFLIFNWPRFGCPTNLLHFDFKIHRTSRRDEMQFGSVGLEYAFGRTGEVGPAKSFAQPQMNRSPSGRIAIGDLNLTDEFRFHFIKFHLK